jgi:hypothetical protein
MKLHNQMQLKVLLQALLLLLLPKVEFLRFLPFLL